MIQKSVRLSKILRNNQGFKKHIMKIIYYQITFQNFATQIKIPFREFLLHHRCAG